MLTLTNITKSYPGKKNAVENVSLSIPRGEIVGLLWVERKPLTEAVFLLN